jgi:hypothetical protein
MLLDVRGVGQVLAVELYQKLFVVRSGPIV